MEIITIGELKISDPAGIIGTIISYPGRLAYWVILGTRADGVLIEGLIDEPWFVQNMAPEDRRDHYLNFLGDEELIEVLPEGREYNNKIWTELLTRFPAIERPKAADYYYAQIPEVAVQRWLIANGREGGIWSKEITGTVPFTKHGIAIPYGSGSYAKPGRTTYHIEIKAGNAVSMFEVVLERRNAYKILWFEEKTA